MLDSDVMLETDTEDTFVPRRGRLGGPVVGDKGGVTSWKQQFMAFR